MARRDRVDGIGQLAVEQVQIGPADAARGDAQAQLARPGLGLARPPPARAARPRARSAVHASTDHASRCAAGATFDALHEDVREAIRRSRQARCSCAALLGAGCGDRAGSDPIAAPLPPVPGDLIDSERNTIEVFRNVSPSVVYVANASVVRGVFRFQPEEVPQGAGSGFVWDEKGHIVTNYHVVHGGEQFTVSLPDGTSYDAALVGGEPRKDLAVLRIEHRREAPPGAARAIRTSCSSARRCSRSATRSASTRRSPRA